MLDPLASANGCRRDATTLEGPSILFGKFRGLRNVLTRSLSRVLAGEPGIAEPKLQSPTVCFRGGGGTLGDQSIVSELC